jgi:hypothetical protein
LFAGFADLVLIGVAVTAGTAAVRRVIKGTGESLFNTDVFAVVVLRIAASVVDCVAGSVPPLRYPTRAVRRRTTLMMNDARASITTSWSRALQRPLTRRKR